LSEKWQNVYNSMRDRLTENIGKVTATSLRPNNSQWDSYVLEQVRDLLDILNIIWEKKEEIIKQNDDLRKRLEKRDNDITDVLVKVQDWMMKYQPTLDRIAEESQMLGRVEKENEKRHN
jgi:hypothetical protein